MKNILILLFLLPSASIFSQNTWNQLLPLKHLSNNFDNSDAQYQNGNFLLCNRDQIVELNQFGDITGHINILSPTDLSTFVRKRVDPATGEARILLGTRKLTSNTGYKLRIYKPAEGFIGTVDLLDSLGNFSAQSPGVMALDDNNVAVFGRKFAYKVHCSSDNLFDIIWQTPLTFSGTNSCITAVQVNGDFVLFSLTGEIIGLNSSGLQTFSKSLPFNCYSAEALPDGIVVCGTDANQNAVIAKLTFTGDLVWSKVYVDKWYNDIAPALDGGFIATGGSTTGKIVLVKTNGAGEVSWSQAYQSGFGSKVIPVPDGGYFISASIPLLSATYGIKTNAFGVTGQQQNEYFAQNRQIRTEGLKATFEPTAALFFNGSNPTLISPPDSGAATIISFAPWIGGLDGDGLLHLATELYTGTEIDYHAGVVNGYNGDFKRVWLAKKSEIEALRRDFLMDQVLDAGVPFDLLTWPAKGNQSNQYNIDFSKIKTDASLQSAPFVDVNNDGVYNVFDGDYPQIKGDQMAYWMLNDDSTHLLSNSNPLKVDLRISAYVYECPQNESVKNSLFVDLEIINRSALNYENTYVGFFSDLDLGCFLDDYLGAIPEENSYYVYNQSATDANCNLEFPLNDNIPVQTVTFQNKSLDHFIYSNSGISQPPSITSGAPFGAYQVLQGIWPGGVRPTSGGSGYNPGSTNFVDHVFPANPSNPQGWSMCSANLPAADRIAMASHGPFDFGAGESFHISTAFTTHQNIPLPCPDVFGLVKPTIQQINDWANAGAFEEAPDLGVVQQISPGQMLTVGTDIPGAMFQWSTGATSPTITVSQPGEYVVTMTNQTGCQTIESVLVASASGTGAPVREAQWSVYPNPAGEFIEVSCQDCAPAAALHVKLRNAQGVVLKHEDVTSNLFQLGLQGLPSGFYWLELWQGKTWMGSKKFSHVER